MNVRPQMFVKTLSPYLLSHLFSRCAAEMLGCCAAALHHAAAGVAGVAQQVGVNGICELVICCCQLSGAKGLCTGVVRLLSAPLQRHQELLQRSGQKNKQRQHKQKKKKKKLKRLQKLMKGQNLWGFDCNQLGAAAHAL